MNSEDRERLIKLVNECLEKTGAIETTGVKPAIIFGDHVKVDARNNTIEVPRLIWVEENHISENRMVMWVSGRWCYGEGFIENEELKYSLMFNIINRLIHRKKAIFNDIYSITSSGGSFLLTSSIATASLFSGNRFGLIPLVSCFAYNIFHKIRVNRNERIVDKMVYDITKNKEVMISTRRKDTRDNYWSPLLFPLKVFRGYHFGNKEMRIARIEKF